MLAQKPSTATRAADILARVRATLLERDALYKGSDRMYAKVMADLFPHGVNLETERDHHRFHIFMLMIVKVTRYASNFGQPHADSLTDLAAYSAMLDAIDIEGNGG